MWSSPKHGAERDLDDASQQAWLEGVVGAHGDALSRLAGEILAGRCVAFVGAGLSIGQHSNDNPGPPSWRGLLEALAKKLEGAQGGPIQAWLSALPTRPPASDLEAVGQTIVDAFSSRAAFEEAVQECTKISPPPPGDEGRLMTLWRRRKLIREVPFSAVLSTNYDALLDDDPSAPQGDKGAGYVPESGYWSLLRESRGWWNHGTWSQSGGGARVRLLKLHGDANGDPALNGVVLGKAGYRELLYSDGRYGTFLRAVLATKTVLFLGVSFTDAYLNELRSELVKLLNPADKPPPWFAVLAFEGDSGPIERHYRRHEGIQVLPYRVHLIEESGAEKDEPEVVKDFSGFDAWLEAIWERTAPVQRLRALFARPEGDAEATAVADVVWYDPESANNSYGFQVFSDAGVRVERVTELAQVTQERCRRARVLLTRFGFDRRAPQAPADAVLLLQEVNRWEGRPPVIVFGSGGEEAASNRSLVLRHGAYEFACEWDELFELIERLLARPTGWGEPPPGA